MVPVRRAGLGRHVLDRRADGGQHRQRIGLGVEGVDGAGGPGPVARHAPCCGGCRPPPCAGPWASRPCIAGRPRTAPDRPGRAPRCAAAAVEQVGQDRGPHRVEIGGDRIEQAQRPPPPPPKRSACLQRQERPGHRLVHAARAERPAGQRHAALQRRRAPAGRSPSARQRRSSGSVEAPDARHLLDQVGLAHDIGRARTARPAVHGPLPSTVKPSLRQDRARSPRRGTSIAGQRLHAIGAQV